MDNQKINSNTSLIPFNLFKEISFRDLSDPVMIDYDFFLRSTFVCGCNFHLISKPLISYRIHSNQLSNKNISKTLDSVKEIKRKVNFDPGYLTLSKFILASTKDGPARIYLIQGIYAEITLRFVKKSFRPLEWTYRNYQTDSYIGFLNEAREEYKKQFKKL